MLEGRVVIRDCGCWTIFGYINPELVLRTYVCTVHMRAALDRGEQELYLDKAGSVSALTETETQLWLT